MATFTNGYSENEIERLKDRSDREYIESEHVDCPNCGSNRKVLHIYQYTGNLSECADCLTTW